ncbi:hypothetical protein, partial [Acinetobacter nosocomialis]|uniref:hypothetical protein n=1 Tax=Acinetobacter nosocomialis TaxID=106654 RepID=UPI0013D5CAF5
MFLDPAWVAADLRERAASGEGLVLDVHLIHGPDPALIPPVLAVLDTEALQAIDTARSRHNSPPRWIAPFLDRHR